MDHTLRFLKSVAYLCGQGSDLVGSRGRPVQIEQRFRIPFCVQVLIEEHACPGWDVERREETLVEPFAANDVQRLFSDARRPHGKQAEGCAIRQFLAFQERSGRGNGRWGIRGWGNCGFRISKLRLPLRGGEEGGPGVDELQKIELLLTGQRVCCAYVLARVSGSAVQIESDALHGFASGN